MPLTESGQLDTGRRVRTGDNTFQILGKVSSSDGTFVVTSAVDSEGNVANVGSLIPLGVLTDEYDPVDVLTDAQRTQRRQELQAEMDSLSPDQTTPETATPTTPEPVGNQAPDQPPPAQ